MPGAEMAAVEGCDKIYQVILFGVGKEASLEIFMFLVQQLYFLHLLSVFIKNIAYFQHWYHQVRPPKWVHELYKGVYVLGHHGTVGGRFHGKLVLDVQKLTLDTRSSRPLR